MLTPVPWIVEDWTFVVPLEVIGPYVVRVPEDRVLEGFPMNMLPFQSREALIWAVVREDPLAAASPTKNLIIVAPSYPSPHVYLLLTVLSKAIHGWVWTVSLATDKG